MYRCPGPLQPQVHKAVVGGGNVALTFLPTSSGLKHVMVIVQPIVLEESRALVCLHRKSNNIRECRILPRGGAEIQAHSALEHPDTLKKILLLSD